MIANEIIKAALRRLVVVPSGGTPSVNQYADGLEVLNDMIESWNADGDLVYENSVRELSIPANTQTFTIGESGAATFTDTRPNELIVAKLKDASNHEYPLRIADTRQYGRFNDITIVTLPTWIYYRKTFKDGTFYFNGKTDKNYTLLLTITNKVPPFVDGTTHVNFPPEYNRALKANLTIELAPEFGAAKRVTPLMIQQAEESKKTIIGNAMRLNASVTELGRSSTYTINGDTY